MSMYKVVNKVIVWPISILLIFGFFQFGYGDEFCICDDGYIKVESICMPCCSVDVEPCVVNNINTCQVENEESSDCSNVAIEYIFRTNRAKNNVNHKLGKSKLITQVNIATNYNLFEHYNINLSRVTNPLNINRNILLISTVVFIC